MTTPHTNPELNPPPSQHSPAPETAPPPPQGGRGSADLSHLDGISIEALGVFEQRGDIHEHELAELLGVQRDVLRDTRQRLLSADHWSKQGRHVIIHPAGAAILCGAFEVADFEKFKKKAPVAPADDPAAPPWFVVGVPRNPRLVLAAPGPGQPASVRVRVRNNEKFTIGMELTGRIAWVGPPEDLYTLTGNQPRYRGRF